MPHRWIPPRRDFRKRRTGRRIHGSSDEALQQPRYEDAAELAEAGAHLARLPPLVTSWEVLALKQALAEAQDGTSLRAAGRRLRGKLQRLHQPDYFQSSQSAAADEPGAGARPEKAGAARRPVCRSVCEAALDRRRNARRRDAAELSRRSDQWSGLYTGSAPLPIRSG